MFSGINKGRAGSRIGRPASWAPTADIEIDPIACPNCVAIIEPIKLLSKPAIAPTGIGDSSASPLESTFGFIASSSRREIAAVSPAASGSIVACHPGRVESIQSRRLVARGKDEDVAGKSVASLSQISAISHALSIAVRSFVPSGCEPAVAANFFATSRTVASGSASAFPSAGAPKPGIPNPAKPLLIPSCSNCC